MALFHGRGGKVNWHGSDIQYITDWTFSATCDVAETTHMGNAASDANLWKTYLAGFKNWTASVTVNASSDLFPGEDGSDLGYDGSDAGSDVGAALQLWFTHTDDDGVLKGRAIMTGFDVTENMNEIVSINYSFQGSGYAEWSDAVA